MKDDPATRLIEHLPFTTEKVIASRARIGVVVLASDYTIEHELRKMVTLPGVDIYHARIKNSPEITPETLRAMGPLITETAELILPGEIADIVIAGGTYEVTVTWSGGGTTTRTVKVDDTPGETGTEEDTEPCDLERTRVQFAPPAA